MKRSDLHQRAALLKPFGANLPGQIETRRPSFDFCRRAAQRTVAAFTAMMASPLVTKKQARYMLESFHQLAKRFTELVDRLKDCHDPETRKQLLMQLQLTVGEADFLSETRDSKPPHEIPTVMSRCSQMTFTQDAVLRELLEQACLVKDPQKLQELITEISRLIADREADEFRAMLNELMNGPLRVR